MRRLWEVLETAALDVRDAAEWLVDLLPDMLSRPLWWIICAVTVTTWSVLGWLLSRGAATLSAVTADIPFMWSEMTAGDHRLGWWALLVLVWLDGLVTSLWFLQ